MPSANLSELKSFDKIEDKIPKEIKDSKDVAYQMGRILLIKGDLTNAEKGIEDQKREMGGMKGD